LRWSACVVGFGQPSTLRVGGQSLQRGGQICLGATLVDARLMQRTAAVFEFEQCEQNMLSSNVVVAQAKRFAEGQLKRLAGGAAEGDQRRHGVRCGWQRDRGAK